MQAGWEECLSRDFYHYPGFLKAGVGSPLETTSVAAFQSSVDGLPPASRLWCWQGRRQGPRGQIQLQPPAFVWALGLFRQKPGWGWGASWPCGCLSGLLGNIHGWQSWGQGD